MALFLFFTQVAKKNISMFCIFCSRADNKVLLIMKIQTIQTNRNGVYYSRRDDKPSPQLQFSGFKSKFVVGASVLASLLPAAFFVKDSSSRDSGVDSFEPRTFVETTFEAEEAPKPKVPIRPDYKPLPLYGYTFMINPGHGCYYGARLDKGAVKPFGKKMIEERDLNDGFATYLAEELAGLGAKIIYVDNTKIREIRDKKIAMNVDAFIACHCDVPPPSVRPQSKFSGEAIYAYGEKSEALAKEITIQLKSDLSIPNNGIKSNVAKKMNYTVLQQDTASGSEIPSMIIEYGYMTNKNDLKNLMSKEYQQAAGKLVAAGVAKYFEELNKPVVPKKDELEPWSFYKALKTARGLEIFDYEKNGTER